jgi:exosortase/archaeosortase family protein
MKKLDFTRIAVKEKDGDAKRPKTYLVEISTLQMIIILGSVMLLLLPFVTTFNEFVTRMVMKVEVYKMLQDWVAPYHIRVVTGLLNIIGIDSFASVDRIHMMKLGQPLSVFISWNCIGWQSFILLIITAFIGLKGPFTLASKIEVLLIGILGTILMNIFRISLVALIAYHFGSLPAIIFHDYISTLMIIAWLISYWIFVHKTILQHKELIKVKAV